MIVKTTKNRNNIMKVTCRELSGLLDINYLQASSILKVLTSKGVAHKVDTQKTKKKGRPTVVYDMPDITNINLSTRSICKGER